MSWLVNWFNEKLPRRLHHPTEQELYVQHLKQIYRKWWRLGKPSLFSLSQFLQDVRYGSETSSLGSNDPIDELITNLSSVWLTQDFSTVFLELIECKQPKTIRSSVRLQLRFKVQWHKQLQRVGLKKGGNTTIQAEIHSLTFALDGQRRRFDFGGTIIWDDHTAIPFRSTGDQALQTYEMLIQESHPFEDVKEYFTKVPPFLQDLVDTAVMVDVSEGEFAIVDHSLLCCTAVVMECRHVVDHHQHSAAAQPQLSHVHLLVDARTRDYTLANVRVKGISYERAGTLDAMWRGRDESSTYHALFSGLIGCAIFDGLTTVFYIENTNRHLWMVYPPDTIIMQDDGRFDLVSHFHTRPLMELRGLGTIDTRTNRMVFHGDRLEFSHFLKHFRVCGDGGEGRRMDGLKQVTMRHVRTIHANTCFFEEQFECGEEPIYFLMDLVGGRVVMDLTCFHLGKVTFFPVSHARTSTFHHVGQQPVAVVAFSDLILHFHNY